MPSTSRSPRSSRRCRPIIRPAAWTRATSTRSSSRPPSTKRPSAGDMTETGWPLIPREVLPAPLPAAPRRRQPRPAPAGAGDAGRQLPFFGAETTEPSPADLAGLLAGPGVLGRMGGTARVSVEVDAAWRVHVLVAEFVARGLTAHWRPLAEPQDLADQKDQIPEPDVRVEP